MNKIFVYHRSSHHATHSGYGRLIDYIQGEVVYGQTKFPYRLAKFLAARHSQNAGIYNSGSILKTLELYRVLKKYKGEKNIVHFLNGERDVRYLGFLKRKFPNTKFVATFHKPPSILRETITDVSALRKLDGAIAVGANQVEFLKDWLGLENVVYIPHGVDTSFFKPDASLREKNTLLFVGQHLRDFETLNKTIPLLTEKIMDLQINVILHPAYVKKVYPHPNLKIYTNVEETDLLKFYQEATALFLPMLDSTACNSILEAMACGLPVITNDVGGNEAYVKEISFLKYNDLEDLSTQVISILRDEGNLINLGRKCYESSRELGWEKVSQEINDFYSKV